MRTRVRVIIIIIDRSIGWGESCLGTRVCRVDFTARFAHAFFRVEAAAYEVGIYNLSVI